MDKTLGLIGFLTILVALLLATILFFVINNTRKTNNLSLRNHAFITCVSQWANKTAARTSLLTGLNIERQDKLDILIRDFGLAQDPKNAALLKVKFFKDLDTYIQISDKYKKTLVNHPLPQSPKLTCANVKG